MDNMIYNFGAFLLPLVTNVIVLVYSFIGYQRTKRSVFGIWIAASVLSLVGVFALYGLRHSKSSVEQHGLWIFWSLDYSVAVLLGTYGIILLMRHVLSQSTAKPDA